MRLILEVNINQGKTRFKKQVESRYEKLQPTSKSKRRSSKKKETIPGAISLRSFEQKIMDWKL